jgi:hypothetical protein
VSRTRINNNTVQEEMTLDRINEAMGLSKNGKYFFYYPIYYLHSLKMKIKKRRNPIERRLVGCG